MLVLMVLASSLTGGEGNRGKRQRATRSVGRISEDPPLPGIAGKCGTGEGRGIPAYAGAAARGGSVARGHQRDLVHVARARPGYSSLRAGPEEPCGGLLIFFWLNKV